MATAAQRRAARKKAHGFTPYVAPTAPPPGSYDPALDAQLGQATRGYLDLQQDAGRDTTRREDDYLRGRNDLGRSYGRSLGDLTQSRDRGLTDLGQARRYQTEDDLRARQTLDRSYARLGDSQRQSINQAGLSGGGAALQAARKRTENKAWDLAPIDQANQRAVAGFDSSERRLNEDFGTQSGRLGEDRDLGLGQLALGQQRAGEDSQTQLQRGQRELTEFGLDIGAGRFYQASGTGWAPPPKPGNENTRFGVTYQRDERTGGATLPSGRRVTASGLRSILARARAKNPTAARV